MEALSSVELFGEDFGAQRMWGLREFPFADTTSWLPQTIGWAYLGILLFALSLIYGWRRYQHWKQQAFRRHAISSLMQMRDDLSRLNELPQLLRHVALCTWPRGVVTGLHGVAWIRWLNEKAGKQLFKDSDAEILNRLAYTNRYDLDKKAGQQLIDASLQWVGADHV